MISSEIRKRFVDFYTSRGYRALPRAPMVDDSIPMSFVMSAGLIQVEQSLVHEKIHDCNKFVLVQDCFRHFDLDKVGTDDSHLSIFEMPGAFLFGPSDKNETIELMWELATVALGINPDCIWASYFGGGDLLGNDLPEDKDSYLVWEKLGLPAERIVALGSDDNYWLQGPGFSGGDITRKAGPNTELFYDRGRDRACGVECQPGCKCGRFLEFANSLFIRYKVDPEDEKLEALENPFTETVIGSERIAMILQGTSSVFETDRYVSLISLIRNHSQFSRVGSSFLKTSERILADHLRALVYLIADDAPPPGKNG